MDQSIFRTSLVRTSWISRVGYVMPISNSFSTLNELSITKNILKGSCSWQQHSIQVMSRHFSPSRTLGSLLMASCNLPPTILKNVSRKRHQYKVLICFICALFCRLSDDYKRVPQKVHEFDAAHEKSCNTLKPKNTEGTCILYSQVETSLLPSW